MAGFQSPNHTQTPNDLFDTLLAQIDSLAELKVTLAVIRKTLGYHKKKDQISFRQLQVMTGMGSEAVQNGIDKAIARGTVEIVGQGVRKVNIYGLVMDDRIENRYSDHIENRHTTVSKIKATKETSKKKKDSAADAAQGDSKPKAERPRDLIFDAVALGSFGLRQVKGDKTTAARIAKVSNWLKQQENVTAERVAQFYEWYAGENEHASAPRDVSKFAVWWAKFDDRDAADDDPYAKMFSDDNLVQVPK